MCVRVGILSSSSRYYLEHEHNTPTRQDTDDQQYLDHEHNTQTRQDTDDQQYREDEDVLLIWCIVLKL
jgi:hypothetical protein